MKASYFILFLLIALCFRVEAQSLDEYLKIAEENNPALKSKLFEFEAAMQQVPQVGSLPDPGLTVTAFGQMVETRVGQQMARFSLEQMFPWFGTLAAQKNAAALSAQARYQSYLDAKNELAFNVRSAYYPLYELEQQLLLQKENLEIFSTYKTLATSRFQNGNGKLADALQVDIMTNELQTELAILEARRKPLQVAFNRVLNRPSEEEVIIASDLTVTQEPQFLVDSVLSRNPRLTELDQWIASAQAQQEVATKQGMPQLGIGFEYIITAERPDMDFVDNGKDAYMAMFSVSLPIYRKKYKASVSEAKQMQLSFREMKTDVANALATEFEEAIFERDKAKTELNLYASQTERTQQVVDLLLTGYGNSGADFEEILRMQQMLLKYKMNTVTALIAYKLAEAKLFYLVANDK